MSAEAALFRNLCGAVAEDLYDLAILHDREPTREVLQLLREQDFPESLSMVPLTEQAKTAYQAMDQAVKCLPQSLSDTDLDELAADYASIYLHGGFGASPHESAWVDDEGLLCQAPMFEVRKCYERHGLAVESWRTRADDHLVNELLFLSSLLGEGGGSLAEAKDFLDQHLLVWIRSFAERVAQRAATPFFASLAVLTAVYLEDLCALLDNLEGGDGAETTAATAELDA